MGRAASRKKKNRRSKKSPGVLERIRGWPAAIGGLVFGSEVEEETAEHFQEIKGIVLFGLSLWLLVSLSSYFTPPDVAEAAGKNWGGQAGHYLATLVFLSMGWSGYLLVFLGMAWGGILVARKEVVWPTLRVFGALCFLVSTAFLFQLGFGEEYTGNELPYGPGGWLALELGGVEPSSPNGESILVRELGGPGAWILLSLAALISFMLATEMAFYNAAVALFDWLDERREERGESMAAAILGWTGRLLVGLWNFLKGPEAEPEVAVTPRGAVTRGRGKSAAKRSRKRRVEETLFEEDDEEEEPDEEEEDEEEWAYVDQDGNPIDPDELDEYEDADDEEDDDEEEEYEEEDEYEEDEEELEPAAPATKGRAKGKAKAAIQNAMAFEPPTPPAGPWKFPPIELLEPPTAAPAEAEAKIEGAARKLENALASFNVEASVQSAQVGPTVTLFELEVSQGTRMNKVTALSSEISAALKAKSVRIIAPIPGKSTIGIEVPNSGGRQIVRLSQLISQDAYDKQFAALPMFLGMDTEGHSIVADLARMPHLLIAGTTGSGKSVCINTILASLLLTRSPHDVQLILVDPKMVELMTFSNVPHLLLPIVTDAKQATNVLLWVVEKMEGRYDLFKNAGVKNIKSYNSLGEDKLKERLGEDFDEERTPRHVPYIVVVIDEMADLMMVSKKEAELSITRLAQKSRAVGIHVIVATQRPSTDVITGVIKGNLPTRIAFQVASKIDSRVILDTGGAEKLLGSGDMLYNPPQSSQIKRIQGALVEDHEITALVDFVTTDSAPNFNQELVQSATGVRTSDASDQAERDDLWDEAVRVILKSRRGSASLLQRALGIGYTRASRLIDMMTEAGIVGDHKGSKAREVLLSLEDWEEMYGATTGSGASDG